MRTCIVLALLAATLCAQRRSPQNKISDLETPVATFQGKLKSLTKKEIVLDVGEDQSITFHISGKTKFLKGGKPVKPSAIPPGAAVTVEGKRDLMGNVDAVSVTLPPDKS